MFWQWGTSPIFSEFGINPVPTLWHGLVVGIVPVANLLVWARMRNNSLSTPRWLVHLNAIAIGVSLIYTLQYAWLLPVGILLTFFLIGLMALCPGLALVCSLACRGYLCAANARSENRRLPGMSVGIVLSLILLGLPFVFPLISECGLHLAGSNSLQRRQQGLDWLRRWGDRSYLLRSCYEQPDATIEWLGSVITDAPPIDTSRAQKVYYQVTGDPFHSVGVKQGWFARWLQIRSGFDENQGGTVVGRQVEDLSLRTSRVDVFIDAEVSLANIEWTLAIKNDSWRNQEARIQIALPPGGVVSRVSLWVNGKERDAVIAATARARQAYQRVVQQRRDPILVTTHGPDRVLVQCFPVPPGGGEMKFRLGITAPVKLESLSQGYLRLPYFEEENCSIGDGKIHRLRTQTNPEAMIAAEPLQRVSTKGASAIWHGRLTDAELASPRSVLVVQRSAASVSAWTVNPFPRQQSIIWQSVREKKISSPNRLVLVVDASASMTRFIPEVADSLSALPAGTEIGVLVVSDGGADQIAPLQLGTEKLFRTLAERLKAVRCEGGKSNIPALLQAWDLAVASPTGMIVWVHGPIPELPESTDPLLELLGETDERPRFLEVQSERGLDRLAEEINNVDWFEHLTRRSSLSADLRQVFSACSNQSKQTEVSRQNGSHPPKNAVRINGRSAWAMASLWANDRISRLLAGEQPNETEALAVARTYQLVSPIGWSCRFGNR